MATDAKQRIISNSSLKPENQTLFSARGKITPSRVICAEPSPDVAVALSQGLAASIAATLPKGPATINFNGNVSYSMSEAVAQLGERLGTIQLLRDKMYRACEAYSNGAISATSYTLLMSRYDKTMATLMLGEVSAGAYGRALASLGGKSQGSSEQKQGSNRWVDSIKVDSQGAGYTAIPEVRVSGGGGTGAKANAILGVVKIIVPDDKRGSNYPPNPRVTVKGDGAGAKATATVVSGSVTKIDITDSGSGYTKVPEVEIKGENGAGSGAQGTAILGVVKIEIPKDGHGSGYTGDPDVKILDGGGTESATATAIMKSETVAGGQASTSAESNSSDQVGTIAGKANPSDAVVREINQMHQHYLDKDDLGTLLDSCISASDLLNEPTEVEIAQVRESAKNYEAKSSVRKGIFEANETKRAQKSMVSPEDKNKEDAAVADAKAARDEFLRRVAESQLSPLGKYCVGVAFDKIIKVYEDRESTTQGKIRMCESAIALSKSGDAGWKAAAQRCISTLVK